MPNDTTVNPLERVNVLDLFARDDVENFTETERAAVISYMRDLRAKFAALEAEGKSVRAKKKPAAKPAETVDDILAQPVGETK